jgi:lipoyl(octanoyl) transferase
MMPIAATDQRPSISDVSCCRLIIDEPASGSWNMAVDEALLAAAIDDGVATLRLYQWNEPTLSLGYFQQYDDRRQHAASLGCAVVRRPSGGGAILHDRELTYSLTLPLGHPGSQNASRLYSAVHRALMAPLALHLSAARSTWTLRIGLADAALPRGPHRHADAEPFLCFQRRSPGDVLLVAGTAAEPSPPGQDWKIIGSAQRRRGGAILQHGSVLLERSPAAPELPGWRELTGVPVLFARLAEEFPHRLAAELAVGIEPTSLAAAVCDAVRRIEREKFAARAWTNRR